MTTFRAVAALALLLVAGLASAADEFKITLIGFAYGPQGPMRKSNQMIPGDEMFVRYLVQGVKTDDDGKVKVELRYSFLDPDGKELGHQESLVNEMLGLGGTVLYGFATMATKTAVPPGEYTVRVTIRDHIGQKDATLETKVVVLKPRFGIARLRFFHDPERKLDATTQGMVGDRLFFPYRLVNFLRDGGVHLTMEVQLYEAANETPLMVKPLQTMVKAEKPEEIERTATTAFGGFITLSRPGDYLLRIRVVDEKRMNEEQVDLPLKVRE